MITNQVIQNSIDDLCAITKIDFSVFDEDGRKLAATTDEDFSPEFVKSFMSSPADSQVIGDHHLMKVLDENVPVFALVSKGKSDEAYTMGRICVSQLQALLTAYREKFDRNNFFQNLLLDNLLLVDIYNRAKKLRVDSTAMRVVFLIEACIERDNSAMDILKGMFSTQSGDYITAVDEKNIVLIKQVSSGTDEEELKLIGSSIVDLMNTEAMMNVRVAFGTVVNDIKDVSKSYKEAKMALEVGKIFYVEQAVNAYSSLGVGRLIYQLPPNLCRIFLDEILKGKQEFDLDDETLKIAEAFFANDLNISQAAQELYIHRNTLVYRLAKLEKETGLDIRTFDDALTFKLALMVESYLKYLNE